MARWLPKTIPLVHLSSNGISNLWPPFLVASAAVRRMALTSQVHQRQAIRSVNWSKVGQCLLLAQQDEESSLTPSLNGPSTFHGNLISGRELDAAVT